jgi:hypothetical protein
MFTDSETGGFPGNNNSSQWVHPPFSPPKWMFKREHDDNMMIYHVFLRQAHAMCQDPTPVFTAQELWMLWTFICPWILQKAIHGRKETDNSRFRQQTETPQENATKPSSPMGQHMSKPWHPVSVPVWS